MKGYWVDTNTPSELTRERPDARVELFLDKAGRDSVFLSVLTIGEICKGIATFGILRRKVANLPLSQKRTGLQDWLDHKVRSWFSGRILPVSQEITERWGFLATAAKQKGMTLAVVDGIIAASALLLRSNARYAE